MTTIITREQYKRMMERIKEEYPEWVEGDFSNVPINVSGFLDIDREEFIKIVRKELERFNIKR